MEQGQREYTINYNKFKILNYHRITTESGKQYLVHKGPDFGRSSETVVTDAHHMSSKWKVSLLK